MYIAKVHIGGKYMPGDALPDDMPAETLAWLISAGAVRMTAPVALPSDAPEKSIAEAPADAGNGEAVPPAEHAEDGEDEIDEDAEVPEIDVMAGIVKEAPADSGKTGKTEEKPKPMPKARAATPKPPKGGKAK